MVIKILLPLLFSNITVCLICEFNKDMKNDKCLCYSSRKNMFVNMYDFGEDLNIFQEQFMQKTWKLLLHFLATVQKFKLASL